MQIILKEHLYTGTDIQIIHSFVPSLPAFLLPWVVNFFCNFPVYYVIQLSRLRQCIFMSR